MIKRFKLFQVTIPSESTVTRVTERYRFALCHVEICPSLFTLRGLSIVIFVLCLSLSRCSLITALEKKVNQECALEGHSTVFLSPVSSTSLLSRRLTCISGAHFLFLRFISNFPPLYVSLYASFTLRMVDVSGDNNHGDSISPAGASITGSHLLSFR